MASIRERSRYLGMNTEKEKGEDTNVSWIVDLLHFYKNLLWVQPLLPDRVPSSQLLLRRQTLLSSIKYL